MAGAGEGTLAALRWTSLEGDREKEREREREREGGREGERREKVTAELLVCVHRLTLKGHLFQFSWQK